MNHTIATLALTLLLGSGIPSQARSDRRNDGISWSAAADYATTTLADNFWRVPGNGFVGKQPPYHFTNGVKGAEDFSNNYWPQAHGMDVFIDAYLRAQREGDRDEVLELFVVLFEPKPSTRSASTKATATRSARAKSNARQASSGPATA